MSGRYLLDTNVAIQVLNQELDLATRQGSGAVAYLSLTVVGELLFGAAKSARPQENRLRVEQLVKVCPPVPHDLETAYRYAAIKIELRRRGRPIPENDIWIAAAAMRHGLVLATRDQHFDQISGLPRESW